MPFDITDTTQVVVVKSTESMSCPICRAATIGGSDMHDSMNHVLGHGCKLLHVGSDWSEDSGGKTIAVLTAVFARP